MFNLFTVITPRHDCGRLFTGRIGTGFFPQKMQKHSDSCEELKRPVCPSRHCFVKKTLVHVG